jgi:hypothetical protein
MRTMQDSYYIFHSGSDLSILSIKHPEPSRNRSVVGMYLPSIQPPPHRYIPVRG